MVLDAHNGLTDEHTHNEQQHPYADGDTPRERDRNAEQTESPAAEPNQTGGAEERDAERQSDGAEGQQNCGEQLHIISPFTSTAA